jgi:hypothetical protein
MVKEDKENRPHVECQWYANCPMRRFHNQGKLDIAWIREYCKGDWKKCVRYKLQKKGTPGVDWLLPDGTLDENLR